MIGCGCCCGYGRPWQSYGVVMVNIYNNCNGETGPCNQSDGSGEYFLPSVVQQWILKQVHRYPGHRCEIYITARNLLFLRCRAVLLGHLQDLVVACVKFKSQCCCLCILVAKCNWNITVTVDDTIGFICVNHHANHHVHHVSHAYFVIVCHVLIFWKEREEPAAVPVHCFFHILAKRYTNISFGW